MKIRYSTQQGSMLLVTLFVTGMMTMILLSYLSWANNNNVLTMRTKAWTAALPVAESGVEEALTHLAFTNVLASSGWQQISDKYSKSRTDGDAKFTVTISTSLPPVIVSEGSVKAPLSSVQFISRKVQIVTTNNPLFSDCFVVRENIELNGHNLSIDSFDSSDSQYSKNGQYDAARRKDGGGASATLGITDAMNGAQVNVYGKIRTAPGAGTFLGSGGSVGSLSWHQAGSTGYEPGWVSGTMRFNFSDQDMPTGGLPPSSGTVAGTSYQYVLPSGNWEVTDITGGIYVSGDATLKVQNSIQITAATDALVIGSGASLKLYMNGSAAKFSSGGIQNNTGNPLSLQYFGGVNNTSLDLTGSPALVGSIYAPEAVFSLGASALGTVGFIGTAVTKNLQLAGPVSAHFDEALLGMPGKGYRVISWKEL